MFVRIQQNQLIPIIFIVWAFVKSFFHAQVIPLMHLDGAYQTASALIRLDNDSIVGNDFFPYLGIGPLFMHLPFFKLLGSSISASVVASHFLTLILLAVSLSLLLHIFLEKTPLCSFAIAGLMIMICYYTNELFFKSGFINECFFAVLHPGNSLKPIRASLPYIVGWLFIAVRRSKFSRFQQTLFFSLVLSVCMLWSNDYALLTTLVFGAGWAIGDYLSTKIFIGLDTFQSLRKIISYLFSTVYLFKVITLFVCVAASYFILLLIVTAGHPLEFLSFNYLDVRGDQWWYFGPYGSDHRVYKIIDVVKVLAKSKRGLLHIFLGVSPLPLVILLQQSQQKIKFFPGLFVIFLSGLSLLLGGLIPIMVGHFSSKYLYYFGFWGLSCSSMILFRIIHNIFYARQKLHTLARFFLTVPFVFFTLLLLVGVVSMEAINGITKRKYLFDNPNYTYASELGGFIPEKYRQKIESIRPYVKKGGIQEEYFGVASAYYGSNGVYPVDSLIHLLGSLRVNYKTRVLPEMVIVTNPFFSHWQSWSMSQNWWFYKKIFSSYKLYSSLPTIDIYKKKIDNFSKPSQELIDCEWAPSKSRIVFQSNVPPGLYSVNLNYTSFEGRGLVLIENRISRPSDEARPSDEDGYVSIDPQANAAEFPVIIAGQDEDNISVRLLGEFRSQDFEISQCSAMYVADLQNRLLSGAYFKSLDYKIN